MHILLIARHYPPEVSGGARRPLLYVKALRQLGHKVTIVTPFHQDDPDSIVVENAAINRSMATQKNAFSSSQILSKPSKLITRLKNLLREWIYYPDNNRPWANEVIETIKLCTIQPDWIITTSPPESTHIAGAKLSKHLGVPWLAEFRDTWIEKPHRKILEQSKLRVFIEKRMAKKTLKHANAITAVSEAVIQEARQYIVHGTAEIIIPHFSDTPPKAYQFDSSKLNLVHTGGFTLSDRKRTLPPLIDILDGVSTDKLDLILHIAGPLTPKEISIIKAAKTNIEWHGPVDITCARSMQAGADGLLLYTPPNSHALPGKYAEYVLAQRPIFYMGGGSWLKLVDSTNQLRLLESELPKLEKNETISKTGVPTDLDAAKALISFLKNIESGKHKII